MRIMSSHCRPLCTYIQDGPSCNVSQGQEPDNGKSSEVSQSSQGLGIHIVIHAATLPFVPSFSSRDASPTQTVADTPDLAAQTHTHLFIYNGVATFCASTSDSEGKPVCTITHVSASETSAVHA